MKNKIGIFIIFSLSFLYVNAQSVKGVVVDKKGSPLPFANVVQLSKDSTYISGITTDDKGFFILSKVTDAAILRISYVGFQPLFLPVSSIHKDTDLRKIVVEESKSTLSEVVVTGSRPLFRQEEGSLFTQVQGTILSKLPTVDNLLSQLPGAVKGRTGSIEIFGKGSPVIYINKRPIRSYTEVERLQPSDIKNIELITSPGPEFGASGRAVIRITTLRKSEGFSLLSRSNLKQRTYLSGGQSVDLGYQFHKLSIAGNLGYQYSHGRLTQPASTELQIGETLHQYDREQWGSTRTPTFNYQLSLDYSINDKHSLGFSFDGSQNTNKEHRNGTLNYLTDHQLANSAVVENHYRNKTDYLHVNTFYNGTFGKVNTTLNADYVRNENDYVQNTAESHQSLPLIKANSTGNGKQNLFAVKSDWTWNISPDTKIKWGAEWGYASNNGNLSIASANDINSDYRTQEHRYALYAETSQKIKNLSLSGGVRYEDYAYRYDDRIDEANSLRKHYRNIFPSFRVSYNVGSWSNTLSFNSQISRPTFRQLSNASYYGNEYMYQHGNPLLVPSRLYSAQFYSSYKFVRLSVSYTYNKNYIATNFYNNGKDNIVESTYKNYPALKTLNMYLNIQKKWGVWSPSLSLGVIQPFFKYNYRGQKIKHNKISAYAVLSQFFQLPHNFILSSYVYYNTGGNQGAVELQPYHSIDFGLQKTFLSDRLTVSLQAKDIFHGMKFKEKEFIDSFRFTQTEDYHLWNFSLNIIYKLNTRKAIYRGNNSLKTDIKRL